MRLRDLGLFRLEKRRLRGWSSSVFLNIWWEGVKKMELGSPQWHPVTGKGAQTETQEIPPERKETLFHCVDGWTWEHVAQTGWGVSILADIQTPKWPALVDPAWAKEVDWTISRDAFQPQLCCDSVKWIYKYTNDKVSIWIQNLLKLNTDLTQSLKWQFFTRLEQKQLTDLWNYF